MLLTVVVAFLGTAPQVTTVAGACLGFAVLLLWRRDDPPILLLPVLFQWSEVAIWPLSTVWRQVPLNSLSYYGANLEQAALYGFAGVAALAVGLRVGAGSKRGASIARLLQAETLNWRFRDVAVLASVAIGLGYAFGMATGVAGPARELFNQASNVKYVGVFMLAYWCLLHGKHYRVLTVVIAFEIALGMTGFFAEFKNSLLTLVIAALAARPKLRGADMLIVSVVGALLLVVSIFWSATKEEYRAYVNQGTGAQVVMVPLSERLGFLTEAIGTMDAERFADGFDRLIDRHGYIEFLGLTMANVPTGKAHENGQRTVEVIAHIAMPRVFFPSKAPLPSDTEVMAAYTGLPLTWNQNTSISIGYLGELYVDFGYWGGIAAVVAIGLLVGFVYRILRARRQSSVLVTAAFCVMAILPVTDFGTAYVKLIGSFVFASFVAITGQRFGVPLLLPMFLGRRRRLKTVRYGAPRPL